MARPVISATPGSYVSVAFLISFIGLIAYGVAADVALGGLIYAVGVIAMVTGMIYKEDIVAIASVMLLNLLVILDVALGIGFLWWY